MTLLLIFSIILVLELIWSVGSDRWGTSFLSLLIYGVVAYVLLAAENFHPFQWLYLNYKMVLIASAAYVTVGVIVSVVKWYMYVQDEAERISRTYKSLSRKELARYIPNAKEHKTRIINWMGYWPIVLIADIFFDAIKTVFRWIRNLFESIFESIRARFDAIAEHAFRNIPIKETDD